MKTILVTGSSGLIGSEAVRYYAQKGYRVVGVDNDMRRYFFGEDASTAWMGDALQAEYADFIHKFCDIREVAEINNIFADHASDIAMVIHTAAQPSHDWAAKEPLTDFHINASGTLNLLEATRQYAPQAVFIFTSTNKVYGDAPNELPLSEGRSRYDLLDDHVLFKGIPETFRIDQSKHSLFGASKVAADILVQEYGRYFGMRTVCFRGGCLTGPNHSGAPLHGFLSYLMKCAISGTPYHVIGYKGKQVRDNIHSYDLLTAFDAFFQNPRSGAVYNMGGGRERSCSVLEAIALCETITGQKMNYSIMDEPRSGDHQWYITDLSTFQQHYPQWQQKYTLRQTLEEIYSQMVARFNP